MSIARPILYATLAALGLTDCSPQPRYFDAPAAVVHRDGGCAVTDVSEAAIVSCASDDECLQRYLPRAPTGTLYAICFEGTCWTATTCVMTGVGAPDTCGCTGLGAWCGVDELCMTPPGASAASCVPVCTAP